MSKHAQITEQDARSALVFAGASDWVNVTEFQRAKGHIGHGVYNGQYNWLFEEQIKLGPQTIHWYYRTIDEVVRSTALDSLASISIDYDPSFEQVTFHHARILRGDEVIDIAVEARYILMRREKNFESSMLDGQWTLGATLPDIRVGDLIDVAFTCKGTPAIFEDRFGPTIWMQGHQFHKCRRVRLVNPVEKALYMKPFLMGCVTPVITRSDDGLYDSLVFEDFDVEPYYWEEGTPDWLRTWRGFYVSNVETWGEIAELERGGYENDCDYPDGLLATIADIETRFSDKGERIVEALRWVQEHIRYFCVSMGTGGYVPRALSEIYNNRMGDCKDVSKLMVAMLSRLGIEAYPALVDTRYGLDLISSIPRIWAFDHCIVMVNYNNRSYWFDATSLIQYGSLEVIDQADFGYALPLKAQSDLTPMASGLLAGREGVDEAPLIYDVVETIYLPSKGHEPCRITIDYTYRFMTADYMRYALGSKNFNNFAKDTCELYAHLYGQGTICALPQISDNRRDNVLTISQSIETNKPFMSVGQPGVKLFVSPESAFGRILPEPETRGRFFPYDIGLIRRVRHETRIITDYRLDLPVGEKTWHFGPLSLRFKGVRDKKTYIAIREYEARKTYLIPKDKHALDEAYNEIDAYDRLSILVSEQKIFTWKRGFVLRALMWGLPAVLVALGLIIMAILK